MMKHCDNHNIQLDRFYTPIKCVIVRQLDCRQRKFAHSYFNVRKINIKNVTSLNVYAVTTLRVNFIKKHDYN